MKDSAEYRSGEGACGRSIAPTTNTTEPLNVSDAVIHALLSEWNA